MTAELEPAAIQRELAAFARKSLAEAQQSGEFPQHYEKFVNGRQGAAEETVQLPGPILYLANRLPAIVEYGVAFWRARAPKRSGEYRKSVIVLVNGRQTRNYAAIPDDAEVIILATVPYSRKIEVGAMRMRVPPGIAEDTVQAIRARFGNIVSAQRRFVPLAGGYVDRRGRGKGQQMTYPAAVIANRF